MAFLQLCLHASDLRILVDFFALAAQNSNEMVLDTKSNVACLVIW